MPKVDLYHENITHSQGVFPFDIYICNIPKNVGEVANHHHHQCEIIAIKSGRGIVSVNLEKFCVSEGDVVFVPKNTLHAIYQEGDFEMSYENIIFEERIVFSEGLGVESGDFQLQTERFPSVITPRDSIYEYVKMCISVMDKFSEGKTEGYELMVKSALAEIYYYLNTVKVESEKKTNKSALGMIKKIVLYVSEHFAEDITVQSVASEMGYSKSRFMAIFKEYMGTTFTKYLADIRLSHAKIALSDSGVKIIEVSQMCGFANLSYFNRLFKEKYGKSPSEFRG